MKNWKIAVIVIVASLGGIIAAHLAAMKMIDNYGMKFYQDRFMPGTFINGIDVTQMTTAQAKEALQKSVDNYDLTIQEREGAEEHITGIELGLKYVDDGSVDALMADQEPELWRYYLKAHSNHTVPEAFSYDSSYVPFLIDELDCMDPSKVKEPENAVIGENDEGFYIIPEVVGTKIDRDKFAAIVEEAVSTGQTSVNLDEQGAYIAPDIVSDTPSLVTALDNSNRLINADITYDFVDSQWHADKDTIRQWLVRNPDGSYTVDEAKVADWVEQMAFATDTFGLPRTFMTSYGVPIELEGGGDYGWAMDTASTTTMLVQYLYQGATMTVEPNYFYRANDRSSNDIGNTYVEVCISTQTMWYYYNGELLVTTPIISGCVEKGYSTPSGSVWAIDAKKNDWEFTTFPGAFSDYWMPFNDECGIHDASWQPADSYNTSTYITAGSHGCLNTPYDAVKIVFGHSEIGDPVVVYYSLDQVHGPDPWEELVAG